MRSLNLANVTRLAESGAIRSGRDPALHCTADVEQLADSALHRPPGRRRASRAVATGCTLEHLEELELGIGNPSFLGNPVFEAAGAIVRAIARAVARPVEVGQRWAPFGPAEALAAAGWIRRLRILRVTTGRGSGTSHPDQ